MIFGWSNVPHDPSLKSNFRTGSRFWHAERLMPIAIERLLDYGCFDGSFVAGLGRRAEVRQGVDRNARQIEANRLQYPDIGFSALSGVTTDFHTQSFDAASCLEVLEHVPSESELIQELYRILQPGSTLVLSVPHKGLLDFLDTGNIKFTFPWLVKLYYFYIKRDRLSYQRRFIDAEHDMVGDVSVSDRMEHKHYNLDQLTKLLHPCFAVEEVVYYGLFTPVIDILKIVFCLVLRLEGLRPLLEWLDDFDKRFSYGPWSYNIIIRAKQLGCDLGAV